MGGAEGDRRTTTAVRLGRARHRLRRVVVGEAVGTAVIVAVSAGTVAPRLAPEDRLAFALSLVPLVAVLLSYPWSEWLGNVGRLSTPRLVRDLRAARRTDAAPER